MRHGGRPAVVSFAEIAKYISKASLYKRNTSHSSGCNDRNNKLEFWQLPPQSEAKPCPAYIPEVIERITEKLVSLPTLGHRISRQAFSISSEIELVKLID